MKGQMRALALTMALVLLLCAAGATAQAASSSLRRPKDVDDGSWVQAYKYYMDNISIHTGYAILADFDLDGLPELLAFDEDWPHAGASGCFVKYTGSDYIVYDNDSVYVDWGDTYYMILDNGSYCWYKYYEHAGTGLYCSSVSRVSFSGSMQPSETTWFSLGGNMDEGTEEYTVNSKDVSFGEYQKAEAKWNGMTRVFTLNPSDYSYPSAWSSTAAQYSVLAKSGGSAPKPNTQTPSQQEEQWYRVRMSWGDSASQKGAFKSLSNAKDCADQYPGYTVYDSQGNALYTSDSSSSSSEQWYRVRKSWGDSASQKGAFKSYSNAVDCADQYPGYTVYDGQGNALYTSDSSSSSEQWYRVRMSWGDSSSQKGAFKSYSNAVDCADQYPGYSVYDGQGNILYTSSY